MHRVKGKSRLFCVPMMAVFVTLLLACSVSALPTIPNVVTNSGFEGTYTTVAPNWTAGSWGSVGVTWAKETSIKHSGSAAQKVQVNFTGTGGVWMRSTTFSTTATHTYQSGLWVRTASGTGRVQILFRDYNAQYELVYACKTITATTTWQLVTCNGGVDHSSSGGEIMLAFPASGTYYIDDAICVDTTQFPDSAITGGRCINPNPIPASFFSVDVNHGGNFNQMPPIGAGTLRLWNSQTTWDYVEPTDGGGRNYSGVVGMYDKAGASTDIINTIDGTGLWNSFSAPTWVSLTNGLPDLSTGGRFATYLSGYASAVRNYGATRYYEIINEADCTPISSQGGMDLTNLVRSKILAQDSAAKFIAPNITPVGMEWLEEWLRLGGGSMVDALSFHRYETANPEQDQSANLGMLDLMCNYNLVTGSTVTKQAESPTSWGGGLNYTTDGAASGSKMVQFRGANGSSQYASYTVNVASAGIYNLRVHFSNGSATPGSVNIQINSGLDNTIYVPMTGGWTGSSVYYTDIWMPIGLIAGNNTVVFKNDTAHDVGLNLDYFSVTKLKPLFDTEGSAGGFFPGGYYPADETTGLGCVVRRHILEWMFGASKSTWYCWDTYWDFEYIYGDWVGTTWQLCEYGDQTPSSAGVAYAQAASWLTGATMTDWACCRNWDGQGDDVWIVDITRSGYIGYIMWLAGPNASNGLDWTVSGSWSVDQIHDVWGNTTALPGDRVITLGPAPVLLD